MKRLITLFALLPLFFTGQNTTRPDNWFNLDSDKDHVNGVGSDRAYQELLAGKTSSTIVVGVIDSGVDTEHEDLKANIWTNPGEIAGNGLDDDHNGYVDDIHGWNFIGGPDGRNVHHDNLEMTRMIREMRPVYEGKTPSDFKDKQQKKQLQLFLRLKQEYLVTRDQYEGSYNQLKFLYDALVLAQSMAQVRKSGVTPTVSDIEALSPVTREENKAKSLALTFMKNAPGKTLNALIEEIRSNMESAKNVIDYGLNFDYDPRNIVGDDYFNSSQRNYGNADCKGPDSFHGTHVAGIIAAGRNNGIGMNGIAANVRIMVIRCVPDGDERDKDVANGIRYAVDNGAHIINMSFGKGFAHDRKAVEEAIRYAESKNVLLVHGAGNDGQDIDGIEQFPSMDREDGGKAKNFIEVGAISWMQGDQLVASFSNYGEKHITVFAPGVDIYSTLPENKYADESGTSMASPVTAAVAAVLKSYYPFLTAVQLKKIIEKSSIKSHKDDKVVKPGTREELVKFRKLGGNGGMISLYQAILMAEKMKPRS